MREREPKVIVIGILMATDLFTSLVVFVFFAAPLDVSGAYDPIEIPGALQVSTPRAVSEEDIAR